MRPDCHARSPAASLRHGKRSKARRMLRRAMSPWWCSRWWLNSRQPSSAWNLAPSAGDALPASTAAWTAARVWREGEAWFWDCLVDADEANNPANWQWSAGSGADAQPFFRIFNPIAQGERYDPHGDYVRRWVPELKDMAAEVVHRPWEAGGARGYPPPIVDHAEARARALRAMRAMSDAAD